MIRLFYHLLDPFYILYHPFFLHLPSTTQDLSSCLLFTLLIYPSMHDSLYATMFKTLSYTHAPIISLTIPIPIIKWLLIFLITEMHCATQPYFTVSAIKLNIGACPDITCHYRIFLIHYPLHFHSLPWTPSLLL
jgi:hypothetical protein